MGLGVGVGVGVAVWRSLLQPCVFVPPAQATPGGAQLVEAACHKASADAVFVVAVVAVVAVVSAVAVAKLAAVLVSNAR